MIHAKYACADGKTLFARFTQDPQRVNLKHGNRSWRLPIARSGSGARYSNGRVTFWEHQGEATLEGKRLSLKCKVERSTS
ncbi:MAG: MliC family protein [Burkholderiaceae bacterium]